MPNPKLQEIDVDGKVIEREMTKEEFADWEKAVAEANVLLKKTDITLEEKLASVGLNIDDLKSALGI